MKILSVYDGRAYFNFIESLHSKATKRNYAYGLKHFLIHHQLTDPEQVLSISLDSLEEMIKKYLVYLTTEHKSASQARINLAALRHFCKMNKIKLDWDLIYAFKGRVRTHGKDGAYKHDQVNKLLSICNIRMKVIVLIYASTGIRSAALTPLKLKHVQKIDNLYKFSIYDEETDGEYFTLCTPECATAIDEYLEYRTRYGEKLNSESPLIREDFRTEGFKWKKPRHVSSMTIANILSSLLNKVGLRDVDHVNGGRTRKKVKLVHGFRKFFFTQLQESGVDYVVLKMLLGHDMKLDGSYSRPKESFILSEYKKGIDALTIDPSNRLRKKVEKLEVEKTQFEQLAAQIEELRSKIK